MPHNAANKASRQAAIESLAASGADGEVFDILVVGGGVTGAGIALDAASRGLRTAIVESQDWGSGTSSRSSRLVHGGLRYLKMLDFGLVREALHERDLLLTTTAPHLVRPTPFLYPLTHKVWERLFVGAGIALYDVLGSLGRGRRALPVHRHVSRRGLARAFPGFRAHAAVGAIQYWDATVDDARLVAALVRTAVGKGAHTASRVTAAALHTNAEGHVDGATLVDLETGRRIEARATTVISATGVWTEATQQMAPGDGLKVLASKGIHIVVPREKIRGDAALVVPTASSVLFVIPWSRYWVIGTTDTPWSHALERPVPTQRDVDYLVAQANRVLADPLETEDVVGSWAGLRPLLQPGTGTGTASAKVSREHTVTSPVPGFVVIAGGKLTTYRVMAKDAVDLALGAKATVSPSNTATLPLAGAASPDDLAMHSEWLRHRCGISEATAWHLTWRYGADVRLIADIAQDDDSALAALAGAPAYVRGEIMFAFRYEGALHIDDVMERRTRISCEYAGHGADAVAEIAEIAQHEMAWNEEEREREVSTYLAGALAYESAMREPDDDAATRALTQPSLR